MDGITSDKEWEEQIRLGFETAILDSYNDEYSVVIELLRTDWNVTFGATVNKYLQKIDELTGKMN